MNFTYVLICSKTKQIKLDSRTKALCIFDSIEDARSVKRNFISDGGVSIVKCEMNFLNQERVE